MSDSQDEADRLQAAQDLLKSGSPADFVAVVKQVSVKESRTYTHCLYGVVFPRKCPVCGERKPTAPCPHCGLPDPDIYLKGEDPR